jgi:hypothetical protein
MNTDRDGSIAAYRQDSGHRTGHPGLARFSRRGVLHAPGAHHPHEPSSNPWQRLTTLEIADGLCPRERAIDASDSPASSRRITWDQGRDQLANMFPEIGPPMDDAKTEVLAFTTFASRARSPRHYGPQRHPHIMRSV